MANGLNEGMKVSIWEIYPITSEMDCLAEDDFNGVMAIESAHPSDALKKSGYEVGSLLADLHIAVASESDLSMSTTKILMYVTLYSDRSFCYLCVVDVKRIKAMRIEYKHLSSATKSRLGSECIRVSVPYTV